MRQHLLQLYDDSDFMIDRVVAFLRRGAEAGETPVVIATPKHGEAVAAGLKGFDGELVVRDAQGLLDTIMRGDRVDASLFERHVGGLFRTAAGGSKGVRAFGEMVALLWDRGDHDAAVRLERLWDKLSATQRYAIICAYPLDAVASDLHGAPFLAICDGHSHVFAREHVVRPTNLQHRIDVLEREALALRGELSRRMDIQHALSRADETKDDFIAVLSHELRNPLTPILTAVEMLKRPMSADQHQRIVATIGRQTSVLARLVEDLLEGRRITSGNISMEAHDVLLQDVIEQAVETSSPNISARHHTFHVDCDVKGVRLNADATRLGQAISNLLNNAAKFTPEGGTVALKATVEQHRVRIDVRDSGRGMDREFLARAFEPYAQATAGEGGLGLGLAIVKSIVRMHGGTVEATSAGLGHGTTFSITLPTKQDNVMAVRPVRSSRVLVVDDNADVRDTLAALLAAYGHDTRTAASGMDAIAEMGRQPHVVLLDLGMPGMDGFEVAKRIRQGRTQPLLVALSGHAPSDAALSAGFDHQFTKPPDIDRLLQVIDGARGDD